MNNELNKIARQLMTADDWNHTEDVIIMHESEAEREYRDTSRKCENISRPISIADADIELIWRDRVYPHQQHRADEREFVTEMAAPLLQQLCDAAEMLCEANELANLFVSDIIE